MNIRNKRNIYSLLNRLNKIKGILMRNGKTDNLTGGIVYGGMYTY